MASQFQCDLIDILLVEDNRGAVPLPREVLKEGRLRNNLFVCGNGEDAMDFLRQRGKHAKAMRPDLVLLDLNLPRKSGREVLAEVKRDPELRTIPIVVLTTSSAEQDILQSYDLHANCYITKPVDLIQFMKIVNFTCDFWLDIVKLPSHA